MPFTMSPFRTIALLATLPLSTLAHLAAFTDGMYCPELKYKGPLTNFTDPNLVVFDPLYNLTKDAWFLSKGRNCLLAEPTGVWTIAANTEISVPWANWQNSTGYYADGKNLTDRPIPYSVTNPQVAAQGLITESAGLASPNMHAANKSTTAGTAIAVAYVDNVYAVTMENLIVISTAPQTPFERLANYTIPDLAPCESCICVTGWVPDGFGEQNMYMAAHKCRITNSGPGQKPVIPGKVPGPGVSGSKQMIAAFQAEGNTVFWKQGVNKTVPTYSPRMGYMAGPQTDIFAEKTNATTAQGQSGASTPAAPVSSADAGKESQVASAARQYESAGSWTSVLTLSTATMVASSTSVPHGDYVVNVEKLAKVVHGTIEVGSD